MIKSIYGPSIEEMDKLIYNHAMVVNKPMTKAMAEMAKANNDIRKASKEI